MGDVSVVESGATRQLQHAILQLCNEHVSYEHTLQVLGVVCVTVDDQPRDLVVKLNNTLKRVDAVPPPVPEDRRVGTVRASAATTLWPRAGSDATVACSSSTPAGSSTAGSGDPLGRQGTTAPSEAAVSGSSRKCHGRKQSKPVKVRTVVNEEDGDDDDDDDNYGDDATSDCQLGGVLMIAPAETSAAEDDPSSVRSTSSSPRVLRSVGGHHPDVDEELPQRGRRHADTPMSGSAVRALLTGLTEKNDADDVLRRSRTPRYAFSSSLVDTTPDQTKYRPSDSVADKLRRDTAGADVQSSALNFSTRTAAQTADGGTSPDCDADVDGVDIKIKEEMQHPALQMTSYSLELGAGGGCGDSFDMSRSMTAAAAAAAAFSQYVDDPAMLQYDQQRLALYSSLVSAAAASGVPHSSCENARPPPPMSLLNGVTGSPDPAELASSKLGHSLDVSSYVMSGPLGDSLTMQRFPAIRRREKFGRGLHHSHQAPMKVRSPRNTASVAWR